MRATYDRVEIDLSEALATGEVFVEVAPKRLIPEVDACKLSIEVEPILIARVRIEERVAVVEKSRICQAEGSRIC